MRKNLIEKIKESLAAIMPVTLIVLILTVSLVPITGEMFFMFLMGSIFLTLGIGLFTLGVDNSLVIMGEEIGAKITKLKKLWIIIPAIFIIGLIVAVTEPDLKVMAEQVSFINTRILTWTVGSGVAVFLVLAFLRVFFQIRISVLLIIVFMAVFTLALSPLVPNDLIAIIFDSGGVATGPVVVPFIMAIGLGLSSVRGDKTQQEDSFGLVGLCAVGPIAAAVFLFMFSNTDADITAGLIEIEEYGNISEVFMEFVRGFPEFAFEKAVAILPIVALFLVFNFIILKLEKKTIIKILISLVFTYVGLVLFFVGVNVGFMPVGQYLGSRLSNDYPWLLIPIGMVIGYFVVAAEPAVHVLKQQVETITDGKISGRMLGTGLGIGVAFSVGIAMLRVVTGISILWFLIPGYLFALVMTLFVPPIFTSIAFDSGAVASGPVTVTFLLPLALGACAGVGGNMTTDAFGLIAMVAMTPLITIQLFGLVALLKEKRTVEEVPNVTKSIIDDESDDIVELETNDGGKQD
ncbi:MAG: DUF1538 domain-containing protein [Oscillospiraceae bacterium]|nr:DUF1538 domain-containing protein [Oscillospiraceae bacterium]